MNTDFKENLKKYYNTEAETRNVEAGKTDWKIGVRKEFFDLLARENKKTFLELGSGAGYDSQFFMNNGLTVTAVDISREMAAKCREKGIETYELDYYDLSSLNRKFDSVYAINTLLHVPKNDLEKVLREIDSVLESDGLFYMGLYGGDDVEKEWVKGDISDAPRFFAFYSAEYLRSVLDKIFSIESFKTFPVNDGRDIFHSVILRKK
ncbi:MAG: class I SAM-dependent methyltransferase [Clostridia bacterium]|nr:class I SAM-dependent methyltransferase [Clostridia bacterium]